MVLQMGMDLIRELKRDLKRNDTADKRLEKQSGRASYFDVKREKHKSHSFDDSHAGLFNQKGKKGSARAALFEREEEKRTGHAALPEQLLRAELADAAEDMESYLDTEKRSGSGLKAVYNKLIRLEERMTELSASPQGLSAQMQQLLKSIRAKKRSLERIMVRNTPVNEEALRSFDEVGEGIGSWDAADVLLSGLLKTVDGVLNGKHSSVEGMSPEDLENLVNEIDAMGDRHRYTKNQQSLGLMEQESLGDIITRPNRVMQEATEVDHASQIRRETGKHEENAELFENQKGKRERDAIGKKHEILKDITRTNRNELRRRQSRDGLEAARSIMHDKRRGNGFEPLALMGLGGNLYKGFNGMNFMMTMTSVAVGKNKKMSDISEITERYLGLDELYRNFMTKNSDIRNRTAFLKRYGNEGKMRKVIRDEQRKAFTSRANKDLMKKYAEELWKGAFLKEDGSVITERERKSEASEEKQKRKLYADMLRAMGFNVRYPTVEGEAPGTRAVDIFKKLIYT